MTQLGKAVPRQLHGHFQAGVASNQYWRLAFPMRYTLYLWWAEFPQRVYSPLGLLFPCHKFPSPWDDWFAVSLQQRHKLVFHVLISTDSDSIHILPSFSKLRTHLCCEKRYLLLWRRVVVYVVDHSCTEIFSACLLAQQCSGQIFHIFCVCCFTWPKL